MAEFPASLLILNGKSTDNLPLREAIMLLREEGMTIHVRVTWEKGDAVRFVEEARKGCRNSDCRWWRWHH